MNCAEIQNNLIDYVESGLSITDNGNVQAHLMGCVVCRKEAQAIQQVLVAVKNDILKDPGEAYWQNFSTRIDRQIKKEQRINTIQKLWEGWKSFWTAGFLTPAFGVALSMLLVIGGLFLMAKTPAHQQAPQSLVQVLSASKLSPEGVELIISLGDDPYDMASDSTFNTDEDMDI